MKKMAIQIQRSFSVMALVFLATQMTACKEESTRSAVRVAKASGSAKTSATKGQEQIKATAAGAQKADAAAPDPDHIPGMNTSGNAFTGVLDIRADEAALAKNTQCSFEIVEKDGQSVASLNIGGYPVSMRLKKTWVKDKQTLSVEALEAQEKPEVMKIDGNILVTYSVAVKDGRVMLKRDTFIADKEAMGTMGLEDFVSAERKKLLNDKDYTSLSMISDGIYLNLKDNLPQSFSYFKKDLIAGTGSEKENDTGTKTIQASYKNALVIECDGLKSEKK